MTQNSSPASAACRSATAAVRAGIDRDVAYGAVTPPIVLSSNFSFDGFGNKRQYDYTRSGNPTRDLLGEALAELEGGAGGVVTATGMGAITLVLNALLQPGDTLVVPHDAYGGSWRLFNALAKKGAFELVTADLTDPRALADALREPPKVVWIETPSNPLLRITDLRFVIDAAHKAGAVAVVDNTFLSPALQRPLDFGADLVLHSTTKYINGHSDVVGGAVVAKDAALHEQLGWWANALGLTGSPFDSFLTLRGLRTLDARLRVHEENAASLAAWLETAVPEGLTVFDSPREHQRRLRTNNGLERLNRGIKRRTLVATLFPNEASLLRLATAVLMETDEEWQSDKRYLSQVTPSTAY